MLFSILGATQILAQEYYHKFYNFTEISRHLPWDFLIEEDDLVLKVGMDFCDETSPCTPLLRVSKNTGEMVDVSFVDISSKFSENALLPFNGKYYLFGQQAPFTNRPSMYILDDSLHVLERIELDLKVDNFFFVEWGGMVERNGYLYALANVIANNGDDFGLVAKFDGETFLHDRNFLLGNSAPDRVTAVDLQKDNVGNLYVLTSELWNQGLGMRHRNVIRKIDSNDELSIFDSYSDSGGLNLPSFLVMDESNFVYTKEDYEFPETRNWNSLLRGLNYEEDILSDWFFAFPFEEPDFVNNPDLLEFRNYDIFDITKANNGDILICGTLEDAPDSPEFGGPYTIDDVDENLPIYHAGFITRLTKYGELLWQRIFIFTNTTNPDVVEAGFEFEGDLLQIKEDSNGDIYAVGRKTTNRVSGSTTPPMDSIWILKVDENGCLDASDCGEEEVLTSVRRNISKQIIALHISPNPVSDVLSIDTPVVLERYVIHNALGQLEQAGDVNGKSIDVSRLINGIHFITLYTKDSKSRTEKIIKN